MNNSKQLTNAEKSEKLYEAMQILMELNRTDLAFELRVVCDSKLRDWKTWRTESTIEAN